MSVQQNLTEQDFLNVMETVDRNTDVGWIATSRTTLLASFLAHKFGTDPAILREFQDFAEEAAKLDLEAEEDDEGIRDDNGDDWNDYDYADDDDDDDWPDDAF